MTDRDRRPKPLLGVPPAPPSLRQLCARLLVVVAGVLSAGATLDACADPTEAPGSGKAADMAQLDEGENWL